MAAITRRLTANIPRRRGRGKTTVPLGHISFAVTVIAAAVAIVWPDHAARSLAIAAGVWVLLRGPRWLQRRRYVNDLYRRTRKICRDEEYAGDRAQNRRHWMGLLRGKLAKSVLGVFWEEVRRPVPPSRCVQVHFATDAPWWPRRQHVLQVVRRWAREWEAAAPHGQGVDKLTRQVEGFFGVQVGAVVDYTKCRAVYTPTGKPIGAKSDDDKPTAAPVAKLPDRLLYPADTAKEAS